MTKQSSEIDVSIILTVHKQRGYLDEAIKSAIGQNYPAKGFEVILASDGSDFRRYANKYGIRYVCNPGPKYGQSANINNAVIIARGKYIKILHDDDRLPPNALQDLFAVASKTNAELIHGAHTEFSSRGIAGLTRPAVQLPTFNDLLTKNHICGGTVLFSKAAFHQVGGYDESLWTGEEFEFHLRLLQAGVKIGYCPKIVFNYRQHSDQKSGSKDYDRAYWEKRVEAIRKIRNKFLSLDSIEKSEK